MKILTEYRIMPSQCPLWEEHTDNIRYFPSWASRLAKSPFVPRLFRSFIQNIDNSPFVVAVKLFIKRNDYDIVITGDFKAGIFYALLRKIFAPTSCLHLLLDLMLDAERQNPAWRFKRRLQKKLLASVDCLLVFSRSELEYYPKALNIDLDRFRFVPYHTNITKPQMIPANEGYLFSAGKSGRDYETLIKAVKNIPADLVVVSDRASMEGLELPSNVKVYYDVPYDNYLELLKKSKIVIIPIKPHIRSLGMVVMLEAMAYGKPTISTQAISSVDYIKDGENGYLTKMEDSEAISKNILHLLDNPDECSRIGKNALRDVKEHWSFEKYVLSVLDIAKEITNGHVKHDTN